MEFNQDQLPLDQSQSNSKCCNWTVLGIGTVLGVGLTLMLGLSFWIGRISSGSSEDKAAYWHGIPRSKVHPELLSATASIGGSNMAACTAPVDEDSEGFFTLDFVTGDLRAWVYYPRMGGFGGMFGTNVQPMLGQNKNPEYLLVSGGAAPPASGGNIRIAPSLIYVIDMKSGLFAAYTIPWDRTRENSGVGQMSQMIFVGGGMVREPMAGVKKPANTPPAAGGNAAAPPAKKLDEPNPNPAAPQPANNQKGKK